MAVNLPDIPADILYVVLGYFDYLEVLRIRLVSKSLNTASRSHAVLLDVYKRSRVLLPPGPFDWSAEQIERALARSFRLEDTWNPTPPSGVPHPVAERAIQDRTFRGIMSISLILERFLLVGTRQSLRCCDIQTNETLTSLESDNGVNTTNFSCTYHTDTQGHSTAYVLIATVSHTLLILRLNTAPVSLETMAELQSTIVIPFPIIDVNGRFVLVSGPQLCCLYDKSSFGVPIVIPSTQRRNIETTAVLGDTHVLLVDVGEGTSTFQASPLPALSSHDFPSEIVSTHSASENIIYREIKYLTTSVNMDADGRSTTDMDLIALNDNTELWHIRVTIDPDQPSLTITSKLVCSPDFYIWNLNFTSYRGIGRGVCFGTFGATPRPKLLGFNFDVVNHTGTFIELKELAFEEIGNLAYDGITGILCVSNSKRHGEVGVLEYV